MIPVCSTSEEPDWSYSIVEYVAPSRCAAKPNQIIQNVFNTSSLSPAESLALGQSFRTGVSQSSKYIIYLD
jgi:hypothetical protein